MGIATNIISGLKQFTKKLRAGKPIKTTRLTRVAGVFSQTKGHMATRKVKKGK